jgi:hypothetical protein
MPPCKNDAVRSCHRAETTRCRRLAAHPQYTRNGPGTSTRKSHFFRFKPFEIIHLRTFFRKIGRAFSLGFSGSCWGTENTDATASNLAIGRRLVCARDLRRRSGSFAGRRSQAGAWERGHEDTRTRGYAGWGPALSGSPWAEDGAFLVQQGQRDFFGVHPKKVSFFTPPLRPHCRLVRRGTVGPSPTRGDGRRT